MPNPSLEVTIYPATEEEVRSGYVGRQLREFKYGFVGEYPQVQYIRLNARDVDGRVVGGLRAVVAMYWLRVEVLWVSEATRGKGIGARLLAEGGAHGNGHGGQERRDRDV
jgi:GNAT superfamily N-acetyltransferase